MNVISELGKIRVELEEDIESLKYKISNKLSGLQQKIVDTNTEKPPKE